MSILATQISKSFLSKDLKQYQNFRKNILHSHSDINISQSRLDSLAVSYTKLVKKDVHQLFKTQIGEEVISCQKLEFKSTFHILFDVKTKENRYVLKVSLLNNLYKDFTFCLDSSVQTLLFLIKLPSNPIYFIDLSRENVSYDCIAMKYIEGEKLELYKGKNKKNIYKKLGKVFQKIHQTNVSGAGQIDIETLLLRGDIKGSESSWTKFVLKNLNSHISILEKRKLISKKEEQIIDRLFNTHNKMFKDSRLTLLHNDPGSRNIFINNEQVVGIIDWEDSIVGDPYWDIAFMETFLYRDQDKELFENFCIGYGINIVDIHASPLYWFYYLRITLFKAVNRSNLGYYNKEGALIDENRIRKSLIKLQDFFPS